MNLINRIRIFAAFSLLSFLLPQAASALTRVVVTNTADCPADPVVNPCYLNVPDAITAAVSGDAIEIHPGTYSVPNVVMNKSVSLYGKQTAKTVLTGNGAASILTIDNVTVAMSIRRLTFASAATGLLIRNSSAVEIANNIFELGDTSTAIQVVASSPTIVNNTFFANGAGIVSSTLALNIINNIFYQNSGSTAITPAGMDLNSIKYNLFFQGAIGPPVLTAISIPVSSDPVFTNPQWQGNISTLDPRFVSTSSADITQRDFHLLSGTPCENTGNPPESDSVDGTRSDIGAYGGLSADTIPLPVTILSATAATADSVSLTWSANPAYTVKGYKVYYGYASGDYSGNDALVSGVVATSPYTAGNVTSIVLSGLTATAAVPLAPVLNPPRPLNERLDLSWSNVSGATGYTVHYGIASTAENTRDAGSATAFSLTGLTNGQTYQVAVSARAQAIYYLAVTAYDASSGSGTAGVAHESAHSNEYPVTVGSVNESGPSNVVTGMPELVTAYPALPNAGCFIATAAYGSPDDRAVQVLRDFRDRHLMTNAAGRAFVRWYYASSPAAAAYLNDHPSLKPVVRGLLAPCIAAAHILSQAPEAALALVLLASAAGVIMLTRRRQAVQSRTHSQERRP